MTPECAKPRRSRPILALRSHPRGWSRSVDRSRTTLQQQMAKRLRLVMLSTEGQQAAVPGRQQQVPDHGEGAVTGSETAAWRKTESGNVDRSVDPSLQERFADVAVC